VGFNSMVDEQPSRNVKIFTNIVIPIATVALIVFVTHFLYVERTSNERAKQATLDRARIKVNILFDVVDGYSEQYGNAHAIAIKKGEYSEPFLPCSEEQFRLRRGDKVRFEFSENTMAKSINRYLDFDNCHLRIVELIRSSAPEP
jgi:hypothetical protein